MRSVKTDPNTMLRQHAYRRFTGSVRVASPWDHTNLYAQPPGSVRFKFGHR